MKLFLLLMIVSIGFIACSSPSVDNAYYDRANQANDKAQADLQK